MALCLTALSLKLLCEKIYVQQESQRVWFQATWSLGFPLRRFFTLTLNVQNTDSSNQRFLTHTTHPQPNSTMLTTMQAHRVEVTSPDTSCRPVSFAAELVVIGHGATGVSNQNIRSSRRERGSRRVGFAVEVEVIGRSEGDCVEDNDAGALAIDAGALFEVGETVEPQDETIDINLGGVDDEIEGVLPAVSEDAENTDNHSSSTAPPVLPPPRGSSLYWRSVQPQHRLRRGAVTAPLFIDLFCTAPITPESSARLSAPRSPPPPYVDEDEEEDDELMSYRNPVPDYHDDVRPPMYISYVRDGDIVLEDMFDTVGGWFRGVGGDVADAWRAFTYNTTLRSGVI